MFLGELYDPCNLWVSYASAPLMRAHACFDLFSPISSHQAACALSLYTKDEEARSAKPQAMFRCIARTGLATPEEVALAGAPGGRAKGGKKGRKQRGKGARRIRL